MTQTQVKKFPYWLVIVLIAALLVVVGLFGWMKYRENLNSGGAQNNPTALNSNPENKAQSNLTQTVNSLLGSRPVFAKMDTTVPIYNPKLTKYNIKSGLSNVTDANRYGFDNATISALEKNYFVALDAKNMNNPAADYGTGNSNKQQNDQSKYEEFFPIYEQNRYAEVPSFITSDSVLHTYHLMFDDSLQSLEEGTFMPKITDFSKSILSDSQAQLKDLQAKKASAELITAAKRNVAFFTVALNLTGNKLIDLNTEKDPEIQALVDKELKLITDAPGISLSPVMQYGSTNPSDEKEGYKEDYSQYKPRGHYTKTENLKKYFKTMMWYGRLTFRQKMKSENLGALLIVSNMLNNPTAFQNWSDIYDTTSFLVGSSDDLGFYEYSAIVKSVFGSTVNTDNLIKIDLQEKFLTDIQALNPPKVNSMVIYQDQDRQTEIKGFRVMGQRYTLDADVFQNLIYRSVLENSKDEQRTLPRSLDIPASFGSAAAVDKLKQYGDFDYKNFSENLTKVQQQIQAFQTSTWTQNIYWSWLYSLKSLTDPIKDNYPSFMQNAAWVDKDLNTFQGSFTELKHDTLLYAKQVYAELGAGAGDRPNAVLPDSRGYVEPRPELYKRLSALAKATRDGLDSRKLLTGTYKYTSNEDCDQYAPNRDKDGKCPVEHSFDGQVLKTNLEDLIKMCDDLTAVSVKELQNEKLTESDYTFIKELGGQFEHLWTSTLHTESVSVSDSLNKNPAMLVADVATDPNGQVLELGTGKLHEIYVIIPTSGEKEDYYRVARGVIYNQYDFTQPITDRLTDQQWQEKVRKDDVPAKETWKSSFLNSSGKSAIKPYPQDYSDLIKVNNWTADQAKADCTQTGGKYNESDNICRYY